MRHWVIPSVVVEALNNISAEILVRQEQGVLAAIEREKGKKCPLALASGRRAA